ncbi:MAG: hypothetical protein R3E53_01695 [Myxococcota bacterium]
MAEDAAPDAVVEIPAATGSAKTAGPPAPVAPPTRAASLAAVLEARTQLEAHLAKLQATLRSEEARGREAELEAEIRSVAEELGTLSRNFAELASGVDPTSIEADPTLEQLDLTRELRDLLGPLVNELKRATSRPREIDRLRTEIAHLDEKLASVDIALDRLAAVGSELEDPALVAAIDAERQSWTRRRNGLDTELKVARQKLEQRLGESQSIRQAVENVFQLFFKSRGRNLLLALLATAGFLFGIRRLRSFLADRAILSRRSDTFQFRVFSLVYSAFTVIGALLVFLVALYFFGDWVLLILMLLLILGVIWTSKQAIPRFWTQAVLILDMGVVREGERLVWNGLPWLVESISFYSTLSNPGAARRPHPPADRRHRHAPLAPLGGARLWFPTQPGDVVLLPDGRPAEVELQSVEHVRLRVPGQGRVVMPAAQFVQQGIEKLSGYRVEISFGLDYGDQARITTTMRETMREGVEARWLETRWSESFVDLAVEFKEAGASSLDYFVRVDLDGSQAFEYQAQRRALARFCVDVCNEQGWTIPFTQITLHMADTKSDATDAPREPTRKDPELWTARDSTHSSI